jgi:hypothetical protein
MATYTLVCGVELAVLTSRARGHSFVRLFFFPNEAYRLKKLSYFVSGGCQSGQTPPVSCLPGAFLGPQIVAGSPESGDFLAQPRNGLRIGLRG